MKEVPGLVIFCILTLSIAFCLALFMTPSNKDLREVKQDVTQEMAETDKELLNLIERQTDVIRDQAKDIRELRLKVLELEYHRHEKH